MFNFGDDVDCDKVSSFDLVASVYQPLENHTFGSPRGTGPLHDCQQNVRCTVEDRPPPRCTKIAVSKYGLREE